MSIPSGKAHRVASVFPSGQYPGLTVHVTRCNLWYYIDLEDRGDNPGEAQAKNRAPSGKPVSRQACSVA